jgi:hypothetical protein
MDSRVRWSEMEEGSGREEIIVLRKWEWGVFTGSHVVYPAEELVEEDDEGEEG